MCNGFYTSLKRHPPPPVPVLVSLLVVKGSAYGFSAPKSHSVKNQSYFVNLTITFSYSTFVFFVLSVLCWCDFIYCVRTSAVIGLCSFYVFFAFRGLTLSKSLHTSVFYFLKKIKWGTCHTFCFRICEMDCVQLCNCTVFVLIYSDIII